MNSLPLGQAKHHSLRVLSDTAARSANDSLSILRSEKPRTRTAFHHLVYDGMRAKALPSQLACDVVSQVWEGRKTARTF
ncbi:MAG: hypothetical protein ACYCPU_06240, partial [Thermoplasmata archaeon]